MPAVDQDPQHAASQAGRSFTVADNRHFWDGNAATYHGTLNAREILFLARRFVGRRVLDAGAGDGSLVRRIRASIPGAECAGVDLAPKSADVAEGDLTALAFAAGRFDTVFCCEVIEHCTAADTARILDELARVLEGGGHLILTTPYDETLAEDLVTCPDCRRAFHRWGHQQRFVEDDLSRLARAHGLEPISIFPVKLSRVRRLRWLGPAFFASSWMTACTRRLRGHRTLVMVARNCLASSGATEAPWVRGTAPTPG